MSGGNMTGGMMGMKAGGGPNITGSIKMSTVIGNALSSQIKVGLNQSAMTAEKAVGNNSHAVAAHIGVVNGYLAYTVWVIDPNMKFNRVIVDAGNGKVLSNQPISEGESMMIHGMMMGGGYDDAAWTWWDDDAWWWWLRWRWLPWYDDGWTWNG